MADRSGAGNRGGGRFPPRRRGPGAHHRGRSGPGGGGRKGPRPGGGLGLREDGPGIFELVHPNCVEERREDFEEGLALWEAGEPEDARDALRFALDGCGDNLWVHVALGRLALEEFRDPPLARGHFGYALSLAQQAIPPDLAGALPPDRPANRPLYDALAGLIACCEALKQPDEVDHLTRLRTALSGGAIR
jgi:hypothetical protein